jgi:hypothetical protein
MRTLRAAALALAAVLPASPGAAADTPVKSKIVGVDLFKNGLAVVRREATLAAPGTYTVDDVPTPVHGTLWLDSTGGAVDVTVRMRDVEVPVSEAVPGNLQDDLAGKTVTVHFKGDKRAPVTGTMVKIKPPKGEEAAAGAAPGRYFVIQSRDGRTYVDQAEVASVESGDAGDKVTRRRAQLVFTLHEGKQAEAKGEAKVTIRYIAHGLSWAPSYRVDISDPKTLLLEQRAVVRNELADLADAEVRLISGYPSVQYANVRSPLSPRTSWANYFAELAGSSRWQNDIDALSNSIVSQQAITFNARSPAATVSLGATPAGEGVDLHYQSIGKRTLADGDALSLSVAKAKADYERIVEWIVPDTRDADGRPERRDRYGRQEQDETWDALRFKNPLAFPMTTAPATVTANGQFNGQRTSYWVNSGEEMILHVEKALSIRTRATEYEQLKNGEDTRSFVWLGGRQYRKVTVEGELTVSNHRKETVPVVIRRRFSGDLVKAEGDPKQHLREEGVYSVNKRQELVWSLSLKGGEEKALKYTYTVLVAH